MSAPHIAEFMDRMTETGLGWADQPPPLDDGQLHRYHIDGDKPKSRNGWYVLHGGRPSAGCFGSWRTGDRFQWSHQDHRLSPNEINTIRQDRLHQQIQIDRKLAIAREEARQTCLNLWVKSVGANNRHLYLVKKRVGVYGIRQYKTNLLIPVRDGSGQLMSLQFITPSGEKFFKKGGRVKGGFHRIGRPKNNTLYIAEGYATAATIHELTGHSVAVAFNAGNLVDVTCALRNKYPNWQLLIAADNDRFTEGNPGLTQAHKAARLTGAGVLVPSFADDEDGSDFNDRFLLDAGVGVSDE